MSKYVATVCFFIKDKRLLLAEIEYPDGIRLWNGIGGKVDDGETALDAVIREIAEETTLVVRAQDLLEATVVTGGDFELHVFVALSWSGDVAALDPTIKRFEWFDFGSVPYAHMHKGNDEWLPSILGTMV